MNILWITENYPPSKGGMAQSCDRIIRSLRKAGVNIHILHFTNRRKPFATEVNVKGSYTACPLHEDIPHSLNLAFNHAERFVAEHPIDCMMIFGGTISMSAASVFSQLLNLPFYVCLRGNDFDVSLFSYKRRDMLIDAMEKSIGVLSVTRTKAQRVKKLLPQQRSHYTPNGIALDDWFALKSEQSFAEQWRKENSKSQQLVLGLFGDLKAKKGVGFFLQCLQRQPERERVLILFSGEIEPCVLELLQEMEQPYVSLPFMPRAELIKYYLACDWMVIPSFYDGMPNVLLEAGALGIPVIASDIDGMQDVLSSCGGGLLFPPADHAAFSSVLAQVLQMPDDDRKNKGKALQDCVLEKHQEHHEVEHYLSIFLEDGFDI